MDNTLERVKSILGKNLGFSKDTITENSKLVDDLQADSLDVIEIAIAVEREFNCEIPDKTIEEFVTVKDIVNYLQNNRN